LNERSESTAYNRARINQRFWELVFSGAVTYTEAQAMDLGTFEECFQARLEWVERHRPQQNQ
jgi:hypothetical protein